MTIKQAEYALLAAGSYFDVRGGDEYNPQLSSRDTSNEAPIPEGWEVLTEFDARGSGDGSFWKAAGFSARVYKNKRTNEICISYAGTEFDFFDTAGGVNDFLNGNLPAAVGKANLQVNYAAELYERVRTSAKAAGATISFTGHSLGGGLARDMRLY